MICFNFAPFEGFSWDIFRLIKELWAASVVWKSPGCWCVSSCFLSPFYPPFLCCFSLSITAFLLRCQSLACCCPSPSACLLTHKPHQADPQSWLSARETSWGGSAITTSCDILLFCWGIHFFEVCKVSFPGSRECQCVSVSTSISSLLEYPYCYYGDDAPLR